MLYARLGDSGLVVSRLALGAMLFGRGAGGYGSLDLAASTAQVDQAMDAGINLVDTADVYGDGQSEIVLGQALKGRRGEVLISTKVGSTVGPGVLDGRLSAHHIARSIDASLGRLGVEHVDLYIAHRPDFITPLEETVRALDQVVRSGKTRYLGFSNWPAWMAAKAVEIQKREGLARFVTGQMYYSLVARDVEAEIVPCALDAGFGLMVWSPLSSGYLSGKYAEGGEGRLAATKTFTAPDGLAGIPETWSAVLAVVRDVAARIGEAPATVALSWLLRKTAVSTVLVAATRLEQLAENLRAGSELLSAEDMAALDAVSAPVLRYPQTFERMVRRDPAYAALGL